MLFIPPDYMLMLQAAQQFVEVIRDQERTLKGPVD
jgi:hypothetical protein